MLTAAVKTYDRTLRILPCPRSIDAGFPGELERASLALGLSSRAGEIRAKALCLGVLLALLHAVLYLATRDIAALFLLTLVPAAATATLLLLPVALFRVMKARFVADSVGFMLSFSTLLGHLNQEDAYHCSIKGVSTDLFRETWVKLRLGELTSVSATLHHLAGRARPYSEQLYTVFRGAASEVQEEEPEYGAMLRDSLSALQVENSIELGKYAERFRGAAAVASFTPVSLFLALPFASAFTGNSVNSAFFAASTGVVLITLLAVLYLLASYPSSASFADLRGLDPGLARLLGVQIKNPRWKGYACAFLVLFLLSFASPVFLLLLGALLTGYAARNQWVPRLLTALKRETASLPLDMKEISYRLRRGEPLEAALSVPGSLALMAVKQRRTGRVLPGTLFTLLGDVLRGLGHSGEALAGALDELRVYARELLNYRAGMSAQLESARGYLFLLFILLPLLSLFSLWAFDFIARVSYAGEGASLVNGFEGFALVSRPPDLDMVLGFTAPALVVSMLMLALLSVLCEDVVAPQLLASKTWMPGLGIMILGLGGMLIAG